MGFLMKYVNINKLTVSKKYDMNFYKNTDAIKYTKNKK